VVRQVLEAAGIDVPEAQRMAADIRRADGEPRFTWRIWDPLDSTVPMYRAVMTRAIGESMRWRAQYEAAKAAQGLTVAESPRPPP